jgi:3,4-dihydroxy 2-butanone 4-phosphate synthase / GTP cyclohydrolase II
MWPDQGSGESASAGPYESRITTLLQRVRTAFAEIAAGRAIVVTDSPARENEGDLIFAAELATTELVAFTVRHGSGIVCVAMTEERLDALRLPSMCALNEDPKGTAFAVSVDAREGVTTGVSAEDRARTIRLLASGDTTAEQLGRPGHVFPLRCRRGGLLERSGHTEAAVELTRLAGLAPAGVLCEIVNDDGTMCRGADLENFCTSHGLYKLAIEDLVEYARWTTDLDVSPTVRLPTSHGTFDATAFVDERGDEHAALTLGDLTGNRDVLTHVHIECLAANALGSIQCGCAGALDDALLRVASAGVGVVIYLRRRTSIEDRARRGGAIECWLGTGHLDSLPRPPDENDMRVTAKILRSLGVSSVELMNADPGSQMLKAQGIQARTATRCRVTRTLVGPS